MKRYSFALLLAALGLAACGDDDPTSIGAELIPGGAIRTIEVILDAEEFLLLDTAVVGFAPPPLVDYQLVARDFAGVLDAHALYRFIAAPRSVTFTVGDSVRTDTMPRYVGGTVVMRVDSSQTLGTSPAVLALYRVAQAWDSETTTWELAIDSGGVQVPWLQEGGTRGILVDTAIWQPGADSVLFAVDSATVALWSDTTNAARGALVLSETPGLRLRASSARLALKARPSIRTDTLVDASVPAFESTFVFEPPPPPSSTLRVSGTPAWRSFLRFDPALRTRTVGDCTTAGGVCVRLNEATVTLAELLLSPAAVPTAFIPADSVRVEARPAIETALLPLERSPIGGTAAGRLREAVPPSAFVAGVDARFALPVTPFVVSLLREPGQTGTTSNLLALLSTTEGAQFGFGAFESMDSPGAGPKLRLVLTVASDPGIR